MYALTMATAYGVTTRTIKRSARDASTKAVEDMPRSTNRKDLSNVKYDSAKNYITRKLYQAGIEDAEIKCGYSNCVGEYACIILNGKKYTARDIRPTEFDMDIEKLIYNVIKDYNRGYSDELTSSSRSRKERAADKMHIPKR